jgi:MazG family protein
VDAINRADDRNLSEELGDLLLLVAMHSRIGEERGAFRFEDVARAVCEKLVRRHPHVFGDANAADSETVLRQWEQIKREEKGERASVLDGLAAALPALLRAQNLQKKAARVGFDWADARGALEKLREEANEIEVALESEEPSARIEEEIGDLLFSVVNLARKLHVDAETALARANQKFETRFRAMEAEIEAGGHRVEELSLAELDAVWEAVKARAVAHP